MEKKSIVFIIALCSLSIGGHAQAVSNSAAKQGNSPEVFINPDIIPEFPGGVEGLISFIERNMRYPAIAQQHHIQGRCIVEFIVDTLGQAKNPVILKSVSPECDQEAKRIILKMKNWTPGTRNGKKVDMKYTIPIQFRLAK